MTTRVARDGRGPADWALPLLALVLVAMTLAACTTDERYMAGAWATVAAIVDTRTIDLRIEPTGQMMRVYATAGTRFFSDTARSLADLKLAPGDPVEIVLEGSSPDSSGMWRLRAISRRQVQAPTPSPT
jgi:hypothetical protein